jgi:hypothetical protein
MRSECPTLLTADELVAKGKRLSAAGNLVVFLHPSQEWMAVQEQVPFLRYERLLESINQQDTRK